MLATRKKLPRDIYKDDQGIYRWKGGDGVCEDFVLQEAGVSHSARLRCQETRYNEISQAYGSKQL